jgi:hypothetical protein
LLLLLLLLLGEDGAAELRMVLVSIVVFVRFFDELKGRE